MGVREFVLVMSICAIASCGLTEVGGEGSGGDVWTGPGNLVSGGGSGSGVGKKIWYAVGVDYPDEYNWRADENEGTVKCSLVVFANGIPMMKIPVGERYEVSSAPDSYRMIGDCLYTDYSTAAETVIKRNGEQLYRYSGREMILDMIVEKDDVYTLGLSKDGNGFTCRRNGEILAQRNNGNAFPRLQSNENGLSFAFYELVGTGSEAMERYFHYHNGEIRQVAVREDIKKVWDIALCGGKLCYLATMVGISAPVLVTDTSMNILERKENFEVVNCRFVSEGEELFVEGVASQEGTTLFSCIWKGGSLMKMFSPGYIVSTICEADSGVACVLNGATSKQAGIIYRGEELLEMPEGYMSMGGRSMAMIDGILYVGLTSWKGGEVAVWIDKEMKPLKINGFISNITFN